MGTNKLGQILNEVGHEFIDLLSGNNSEHARARFQDTATLYKTIGLITMIASTLIATSFLFTPLWGVSLLCLVPTLIGRDFFAIGSNAEEAANSSLFRAEAILSAPDFTAEKFHEQITKDTFLVNFLSCETTTRTLYNDYIEIIR